MRHGWKVVALTALLALGACGKADKPAEEKKAEQSGPGITLSAEDVESLGITTSAVTAAQYRRQVTGYGVVTAMDTIAQTDADIATAQAAATQSQAAAARAQSLATGKDAAVSREVAETAVAKAAADQAALVLARRKTAAAFGHNAPWQSGTARAGVLARLVSGRSVLVKVSFPIGAMVGATPAGLYVARLGNNEKSWIASSVWDAPADASVPGRSFYALIDGSDLAQNERVTAFVPVGAATPGLVVPAKALVMGESDAWVYQQIKPNTFLRTRIDIGRPMGDGYFVPGDSGLKAGQPVVTTGAGLLLARETNPSTEAE